MSKNADPGVPEQLSEDDKWCSRQIDAGVSSSDTQHCNTHCFITLESVT